MREMEIISWTRLWVGREVSLMEVLRVRGELEEKLVRHLKKTMMTMMRKNKGRKLCKSLPLAYMS